jgi:hypothetical protein
VRSPWTEHGYRASEPLKVVWVREVVGHQTSLRCPASSVRSS